MSDPPGIGVTLGPCDDMRAEVFVRVPRPADAAPSRLEGTLTGPECRRATTLPTTARLVDLGPPPAGAVMPDLVGRLVLTEPAFWTPALPNLYRLRAVVRVGDASAATIEMPVGLRRLGVRGRSLWLDGRRWVPRGTRVDPAGFDSPGLRDTATVAVMESPDEALCRQADAAGVGLVAVPSAAADAAAAARLIAAWAVHPAVMLVLLAPGTTAAAAAAIAAAVRPTKGTVQLGWWVDGRQPPPPVVPAGVEWLAVDVGIAAAPHAAWRDMAPHVPLVACGGSGGRAGCDVLQAVLAAWGLAGGGDRVPWDWAGYLVW